MKYRQLTSKLNIQKSCFFLLFSMAFTSFIYAQPIKVANSTSTGPGADQILCEFYVAIKCVEKVINGVDYKYIVEITTDDPENIQIENMAMLPLIGTNARWVRLNYNTYGFYFVEPFDLQIADCHDIYTILNWPDCGSCHLVDKIHCYDKVVAGVYYPYIIYLSTNQPESIIIEHTYYLDELLSAENPNVIKFGGSVYGLLHESVFDLQITDCSGQTRTNNNWPTSCPWVSHGSVSGIAFRTNEVNEFTIFPNPASDFIFIDSKIDTEIQIFNSLGQFVSTETVLQRKPLKLDISDWNEGVYIVKDVNASFVRQIIKL